MTGPLRELNYLVARLLNRRRAAQELDEEMRAHIEMEVEENIAAGMNAEEARFAALRKFGSVALSQERSRHVWGFRWLETFWQDLRFGLRMLLKSPAFTIVAILTLALGIGANTAIFSIVYSVLLRPLNFSDPDRLVYVWDSNPSIGYPRFSSSAPNYLDWRAQSQSFEQLSAVASWSYNLTGEGTPERVGAVRASASLFPMLGVNAQLGRTFLEEEDRPGGDRVVLLSHGFWQRRYGQDRGIIGRTLELNGESYTVVGVLPASFQLLPDRLPYAEIWTPAALTENMFVRGNHLLKVVGRLRPGVTLSAAQSELSSVAKRLEAQYPDSNRGWNVVLEPLQEVVVADSRPMLMVLLAAVGFVLLIGCSNIASLMMTRAVSRAREIAIRSALGATRLRLIRQFLTESVLLALIGGALGVVLSYWGIELLIKLQAGSLPRTDEIAIDSRMLLFSLVISIITGILFGLVPALQSSKVALLESLKEAGRKGTSGPGRGRLRNAMVITEMALALVLLIGAGLMIRSFLQLQKVSLGFNPDNLIAMRLTLPTEKESKYYQKSARALFYSELLKRLEALPGVESAGMVSTLPLAGDSVSEFFVEGQPLPDPNQGYNANYRNCNGRYFNTMHIPVMKGRIFSDQDITNSQLVVIVNETFARQFWPNEDAIGKRISFNGNEGPWRTIVGVVGDVKHMSLDQEAGLELYTPYTQTNGHDINIVLRTAGDPAGITAGARRALMELDSTLPIYRIRTMQEIVANSLASRRFNMALLSFFAASALLLAAVGIYGLIYYTVKERTHEIGIRIALGAQQLDILKLVMKQGTKLALYGIAIGLAASMALTRLMASLLYQVSATDLTTFTVISLILALVAMAASYIPARRATKVDPIVALRYE